jgi:hypothetical protein
MLSGMNSSIPVTTSSVWSEQLPPLAHSTELILRFESTATARAACDLAALLDTSVDDAVAFAVRTQLRRERALHPSPEKRLEAIREFVTTLADLPLLDDPDEGSAC